MGECQLFEGIYIAEYVFANWRPIEVTECENLNEQSTKTARGFVGGALGGAAGGAAGSVLTNTAVTETTKMMFTAAIATKAAGGAAVIGVGSIMGAVAGIPLLPGVGSVFSSFIHSDWKKRVEDVTPSFPGDEATEWNEQGRMTPEPILEINAEEKINLFNDFLKNES